jgi:hypothetical protein
MNERLVEVLDPGGCAACPAKPVFFRLLALSLGEVGSSRAATTCHNSRRIFIRDYNGPRLR